MMQHRDMGIVRPFIYCLDQCFVGFPIRVQYRQCIVVRFLWKQRSVLPW